jgi:formate dehydrogenase major subunit
MVNVTINDTKIEVPEGTTILQAARSAGINIPTLCDHPELTPYGGCRLCLVDVEGMRTLQPSCTFPVNPNMVVHTNTPKVVEARKFVLTLIFSERNHFCMYCQKSGGDCELQNCAYAEGMTHWPLPTNWQPYPVDASHPDFVLDHNRCILCRRCVRACGELVGNFTLGFEERGASSFLVADLGNPLGESTCISCGTCVQVCPTGALIDRQSAFMGHEAQVQTTDSVCIGCSLGCGIQVATRDNHLVRIEGKWDDPLNKGLLCETGRFLPLKDQRERILTPLVRKNGALKAATWQDALDVVKSHLADKGSGRVTAMASARLSAEALELMKAIFSTGLGSPTLATITDATTAQLSSSAALDLAGAFEGSLDALKSSDCVLVAGVDLSKEHQVAGFFIKRNLPKGTKLILADPVEAGFAADADLFLKVNKDTDADLFSGLLAELQRQGLLKNPVSGVDPDRYPAAAVSQKTGLSVDQITTAARYLAAAREPVFVYGKEVGPKGSTQTVKALVELARALNAQVVSFKGQANSLSATQYGFNSDAEFDGQGVVYLALGDDVPSQRLVKQLEGAKFLVVQAAYASALTAQADVVLPVEMWAEQDGHYVNTDGRIRVSHKALQAPEGILSNQKVLEDLAAALGIQVKSDWKQDLTAKTSAVLIHAE